MRSIVLLVLSLFATPTFAQGWEHYDNARFGYGVDIPPGFESTGESDNGDGQSYYKAAGGAGLLVWGDNVEDDFETEVASAMDHAVAENGWNLTYQATTPRWASYSGIKGGSVLYQRMILLCDGISYAAFRAEYSVAATADMTPVIERLVQALKGPSC